MLKLKGVVYPVSIYKFTLADEIGDRLDSIRSRMGDIDGNTAISLCINISYNMMIAREQQEEKIKQELIKTDDSAVTEDDNKPI